MSDIFGEGHGSAHDWERGYTSERKSTRYRCRTCECVFHHNYDNTPNIFAAMKQQDVPDVCRRGNHD